MKDIKKIVHIVHVVDTEGPLYVSLKSNFERLNELYNIKIEPSYSKFASVIFARCILDFNNLIIIVYK